MPFEFKKTESPARAVRRVCGERIGAARERLRAGDRPAAIHGARKEIKKLRALFRLVRWEIGRGTYRKSAKALREAAGCLALPRDARVMLKAFEKLTGRSARSFPEIEKVLHKHCRRAKRRFQQEDAAAVADEILRKTRQRADGLRIKAAGWAAIEPGVEESYRRGREAGDLARREPSPEHFHEWRKHVKNLWYFFQLLHAAWPVAMRARTDELELLGEQLGEDHDLVLLRQFVAKHCDRHTRETVALNHLIDSRRRTLQAAAVELGARLYAEPPAVVCRRLGNYWKSWRGENRRET